MASFLNYVGQERPSEDISCELRRKIVRGGSSAF